MPSIMKKDVDIFTVFPNMEIPISGPKIGFVLLLRKFNLSLNRKFQSYFHDIPIIHPPGLFYFFCNFLQSNFLKWNLSVQRDSFNILKYGLIWVQRSCLILVTKNTLYYFHYYFYYFKLTDVVNILTYCYHCQEIVFSRVTFLFWVFESWCFLWIGHLN